MLVFVGLSAAAGVLFTRMPTGFLPEEDQGYFITIVQLPDGASKQRTDTVLSKIENYFLANPAIHSTDAAGGGDVSVTPQENAQTLERFREGKLAGAWVPEPWASRMVIEGGGKVLVDERDLWPSKQYTTTVLLVRKDFLDQHPDRVAALLRDLTRAELILATPAEGRSFLSTAVSSGGILLREGVEAALLIAALLTPASFFASLAGTPALAIALMSVLMFAHGIWITNFMTLIGDTVESRDVATTVGLTGFCGGVAGMLSNLVIGPVVDHFSFTPIFLASAVVYPLAWLILSGRSPLR